jgi:hypothetical protein
MLHQDSLTMLPIPTHTLTVENLVADDVGLLDGNEVVAGIGDSSTTISSAFPHNYLPESCGKTIRLRD